MNNILFSIIIPTYNRADFLPKTLESIFQQTYKNYEIIVVDDGSTDNTKNIFYTNNFPQTTYYYKENAERAAARNYGIMRAKGEFVTFLDSDDLFYPNHLQEAKNIIEKHQNTNNNEKPVFISLAYEMKDNLGNILWQQNKRKGNINDTLLEGNHLSCMGVFVRTDIMKENLFNENRELSGTEDWECWMRLASRFPIFYTNNITATMIQHDSRSVLEVNQDKLIKRIDLALHFLEKDNYFMNKYGTKFYVAKAHLWLYVSLHLVLANFKKIGFKYLLKAVFSYPKVLFSRKVAVIIFKLLRV